MGQDYKALTVVYWSLPHSFVKRGISSAEALEVMSKNRTAVFSPFPPCPVLQHVVPFASSSVCSFAIFNAVFVYPLSIFLVSLRSFLNLFFFCTFFFFYVLTVGAYGHQEAILFFKRNVLGIKRLVPL